MCGACKVLGRPNAARTCEGVASDRVQRTKSQSAAVCVPAWGTLWLPLWASLLSRACADAACAPAALAPLAQPSTSVMCICVARVPAGVSLKTQELYALVFVTRYLDLFYSFISLYNTVMKLIFLGTAFTIVWYMRFHRVVSQTYNKDQVRGVWGAWSTRLPWWSDLIAMKAPSRC